MYSYSFNIYFKDSHNFYIGIIIKAKDKFSPYESILIKIFNEKREQWSTSVKDSMIKKQPYNGSVFFNWLGRQRFWGYTGSVNLSTFSPFILYSVLKRTDRYDVSVDTDDPTDISDPGTYFEDNYVSGRVY